MTFLLRRLAPLFIPITIFAFSFLIAGSKLALENPDLFIGVTYDLVLLSPILYGLSIWKSKIPKTTVVPVFVLGLLVATLIIPENHQVHLTLLKTFVLPMVEITVLAFVIWNIVKVRKLIRAEKSKTEDYFELISLAIGKLTGESRLTRFLAMDISAIAYAFFIWKKPAPLQNEFTYNKNSGNVAIYAAIIIVLIIETIALHLWLHSFSVLLAWILTISSLYMVMQFIGHIKAMKRRLIKIGTDTIFIKNGLFVTTEIPLALLDKVYAKSFLKENEKEAFESINLLGELENFNVCLALKDTVSFKKFYGKESSTQNILLSVDEKDLFIKQLQIRKED